MHETHHATHLQLLMAACLTKADILALKAGPKKTSVAVGDVPGLSLIVYPSGRKTFSLFYRANGRADRIKIGEFPTLTLSEAKKIARSHLHSLATGKNPAEARRQRRAADTFGDLAKAYVDHARSKGRRTWFAKQTIMQKYVVPVLGSYKVVDISRTQVARLLDKIATDNGPIMANRVLAEVRAALNWALGRGEVAVNVAMGLPKPGEERARTRVMSRQELATIWWATEELPYPFGPFVKLLILTGQRVREVAGIRRSEINELHKIWTIQGQRTKNGLDHEVPLSPTAVDILRSCPALGDAFLSSGRRGDRPINCFSAIKVALDKEIAKRARIVGWTLHDIRRTFRTGLAELGIEPHIAERALNHVDGGVRRVYDRHSYREQKRDAFHRWSEHVSMTIQSLEPQVVSLPLPASFAI